VWLPNNFAPAHISTTSVNMDTTIDTAVDALRAKWRSANVLSAEWLYGSDASNSRSPYLYMRYMVYNQYAFKDMIWFEHQYGSFLDKFSVDLKSQLRVLQSVTYTVYVDYFTRTDDYDTTPVVDVYVTTCDNDMQSDCMAAASTCHSCCTSDVDSGIT
jgi:hypothetical protein